MKETRKMTDQEFEKLLKDKINQLSDSVNCFGKISERVFHESDAEYEENEFVVSDLENITGKKRFSPIIKVLAAGLASVIAITVIPKTEIYRKAMCNLGNSNSNYYNSIVSNIVCNTSEESGMKFSTYDLALEDYIKKDVLITPLYRCPFEDIDREDIRVRIFVRSYRERLTNQIYAVEYSGDYSEENFIAVAETKAEFTQDELKSSFISYKESIFLSSLNMFNEEQNNQDSISASFVQYGIFKDFNEVYPLDSIILYSTDDNCQSYSYSVNSFRITDNGRDIDIVDIPKTELKWKCSVYANGESALPKEDGSIFRMKEHTPEQKNNAVKEPVSLKPYENIDLKKSISPVQSNISSISLAHIGKVLDIPSEISARSQLTVYLNEHDMMYFYFSSENDPKIELSSSDNSVSKTYRKNDLDVDKYLFEYYGSGNNNAEGDNDTTIDSSDMPDSFNESFEMYSVDGDVTISEATITETPDDIIIPSDTIHEYAINGSNDENNQKKSLFIKEN